MSPDCVCYNCGTSGALVFYELKSVPVHSVLLMRTRDVALNYPRGDITLGFCPACGFISNLAFDPRMLEYSSSYEETQAFSPTFNAFHQRLAARLIDRHDLHNKDIIEIGCGKGEFLTLLCELGNNRGFGFDPSYVSERNASRAKHQTTFIQDFYSEKYSSYGGDLVCCKMTLEHIQHTADFVKTVYRSISHQPDTIVFFMVPNVTRILREVAFWDIYYEHCSYFSLGSLARLFRKIGFDILDLTKDYDDQYLLIEAQPGNGTRTSVLAEEDDLEQLSRDVTSFSAGYRQRLVEWKRVLREITRQGQKAIIWGSGSKAVSFLATLDITDEIEYVVDINPYKQGMYMPGTGHRIVAPEFLQTDKPDVVIVMNPIYREEIWQSLNGMDLAPELMTLGSNTP